MFTPSIFAFVQSFIYVLSSVFLKMQMRTDGNFGFPGGMVENFDKTVVRALDRECREEISLEVEKFG